MVVVVIMDRNMKLIKVFHNVPSVVYIKCILEDNPQLIINGDKNITYAPHKEVPARYYGEIKYTAKNEN